MLKEKTIVCIGIFLILAILTSCAVFYSTNSYCASQRTGSRDGSYVTVIYSDISCSDSVMSLAAPVTSTGTL